MFVKAIETATKFTRPFLTISRAYGSEEIDPGCATLILVNDEGWVLTCKHVAKLLADAESVDKKYADFKNELALILKGEKHYKSNLHALEKKYGYVKGKTTAQMKNRFFDVVDNLSGMQYFLHPQYDIALIRIDGFGKVLCDQYPVFASDTSALKQGKALCRLGYPYPEYNNFKYDSEHDDIVWVNEGRANTPLFPIDGILTRHVINNGKFVEIELSTPGLRGQSGGPLFDKDGLVYGMQSCTISLPLGFDQENREINVKGVKKKVNDYSFIHLGRCVTVDLLKEFMDANGVKYQVG